MLRSIAGMTRQLISALIILCFFMCASCATSSRGEGAAVPVETGAGKDAEGGVAAGSGAPIAAAAAGSELEAGAAGAAAGSAAAGGVPAKPGETAGPGGEGGMDDAQGGAAGMDGGGDSSGGAGTAVAALASTPESPPGGASGAPAAPELSEISVLPPDPETGEEVTIVVRAGASASITYDFGDGPAEPATHVYTTFGVKTVTVSVVTAGGGVSAAVTVPVFARTELRLPASEVEHDASWAPVVEGRFEPDGDFDTIIVYENGREILRTDALEGYLIPVPFTGERAFTASLLHRGIRVAEVEEVSITGLNSPPGKPVFEGPQFIPASPGREVSFTVSAADPNNDPVRYQVKFAPEGSVFDEATGLFTWTPGRAQRGVYLLHFTAYDVPYGLASQFTQRGITVQ